MKRLFMLLCGLLYMASVVHSYPRDSLGMRLIGQTLLGPARQVVVQGNYAYVGVSCGLLILEVSDPANPVEMGRAYDVNFTIIEDVFVQNGYAYLVDAYNGLAIVDVRDVRNPRVVGRVKNNGHMFGVWVKDTLAYMVGSNSLQDSSDFLVINVKESTNPFVIKGYDMFFSGHKLWIVDTLAFMPAGIYLEVFSVADPCSMYQVARYTGVGGSQDLWIRDSLCYVVSQDSGLVILNIRDPLNPQRLGRCKPSGLPMRVTVEGPYAYLCQDFNLYGDYPYSNLSYLWVIDVSDPANPVLAGQYQTPGAGGDMFARDSLVYFADGGKGLRMIDVRNPAQPREITHYSTGDVCWELAKQGNYLYVARGMDGLRVLDVSNPTQPVEVSHLETSWRTFDIFLKDSLLYTAEGDSGLVVVDIRNPAQPQVIGRWSGLQPGVAYGIFVQDTLVYLSGHYGDNLWIVNVADPRNPYFLGRWRSSGDGVYDLWVQGRYAYVPDGLPWTFHVLDVSDPRRPYAVYDWDWPAPGGKDVEFADTLGYILAYFRNPGDGLYIVTIANPVRPDTAGWYSHSTGEDALYGLHYFAPHYVWVGGRTYYFRIPEYCGRIDLVDVRNPHPAQSIRHYETGWTISDVWGEDFSYAYGGAYLGNLLVFGVDSTISGVGQEAVRPERLGAFEVSIRPNPVREGCTIRLGPVAFGPVRLSIYDVAGRAIKVYPPHASRLTPYDAYWDGRDDQGKEVRSGVYFLRAELGERGITKKVVVVK
jgi:hypothetical protein